MQAKNVEDKDKRIIWIYVCLTAMMFIAIYFPLIIMKKTYIYIDIGADTYCSYWPNLAYVKQLLNKIELWDTNLGLGASTITYLSGTLLDPFNWVALLFDSQHMYIGIFISLILKNVLVSIYSYRYIKKKNIGGYARIIAAIMISFSGWFVGWGQHYLFATIYVYFIMLLFYFEDWMQNKKWGGVIICVALLAVVSPYFCYMILLFLAIYYLCSLYYHAKGGTTNFRMLVRDMVQTLLLVLAGIGCAAIIFVPYIVDLLSSPRVNGNIYPSFSLADAKEYMSLFMRLFSNSILGINGEYLGYSNFYESPFMYIGIISLFGIILMLIDCKFIKKYWFVTLLGGLSFVFVNFSCVVFNGFSTKSYRWTFVFIPVGAFLCGKAVECFEFWKEKIKIMSIVAVGDIALITFGISYYNKMDRVEWVSLLFALVIFNLAGLIIAFVHDKKKVQRFWILILAIEMCLNAGITVYARGIVSVSDVKTVSYFDYSNEAIQAIRSQDDAFYRISKNYAAIDLNDSMFQNYKGEKYYSSILPEGIWNMMDLFDLRVKNSNYLYGFDDKQILRNITCGKYRLAKNEADYFGYTKIGKIGDVSIYENQNASSFGIIYDECVLKNQLDEQKGGMLQDVILNKCIVDDGDVDEALTGLIQGQQTSSITKSVILNESNVENSAVIDINSSNDPLLIKIYGDGISGSFDILSSDSDEAVDTYSYESQDGETEVYVDNLTVSKIQFANLQGEISSVEVYELSGSEIMQKMEQINRNHLKRLNFTDTRIIGEADVDKEGMLFIPIPYDKRWMVKVNGEETKIYNADGAFMSVILKPGKNMVEIEYDNWGFKIGMIISIFTLGVILLTTLFRRRCILYTN